MQTLTKSRATARPPRPSRPTGSPGATAPARPRSTAARRLRRRRGYTLRRTVGVRMPHARAGELERALGEHALLGFRRRIRRLEPPTRALLEQFAEAAARV